MVGLPPRRPGGGRLRAAAAAAGFAGLRAEERSRHRDEGDGAGGGAGGPDREAPAGRQLREAGAEDLLLGADLAVLAQQLVENLGLLPAEAQFNYTTI